MNMLWRKVIGRAKDALLNAMNDNENLYDDSSPFDDEQNRGGHIPEHMLALTDKAQQEKDFNAYDLNRLPAMSFKELADWQAKFILVPQAQFIADHEKKLREGRPAIQAAKQAITSCILV
jgi:hypothetical protein